jgi:hypothetical protein
VVSGDPAVSVERLNQYPSASRKPRKRRPTFAQARIPRDHAVFAVHLASRISSKTPPNGILVSRTVKDLVVGSGITFADQGTRSLKGIPGEWSLWSVLQ